MRWAAGGWLWVMAAAAAAALLLVVTGDWLLALLLLRSSTMHPLPYPDAAFWLSWLLVEVVAAVLFTLLLIAFGAMFQFDFFLKNSFALVRCSVGQASGLRARSGGVAQVPPVLRTSLTLAWPPLPHPLLPQVFCTFFVFQLAMVSFAFMLSSERRRCCSCSRCCSCCSRGLRLAHLRAPCTPRQHTTPTPPPCSLTRAAALISKSSTAIYLGFVVFLVGWIMQAVVVFGWPYEPGAVGGLSTALAWHLQWLLEGGVLCTAAVGCCTAAVAQQPCCPLPPPPTPCPPHAHCMQTTLAPCPW